MNSAQPAFGHVRTGKVVLARPIETTDAGNPEVVTPGDPADWAPGILTEDGKFHPDEPLKMPVGKTWVVTMDTLAGIHQG
jgi:hypothetical protein